MRTSSLGRSVAVFGLVALASSTSAQDLDYTAVACRAEFAAAYETVSDAGSECKVMWDVDIAPSQNGDFPIVWEQRDMVSRGLTTDAEFRNYYRRLGSGRPACLLGPGGNPEIFDVPGEDDQVIVWHDGDREDVHWIRSSSIDRGHCDTGNQCNCHDVDGQAIYQSLGIEPWKLKPDYNFYKAAVTDGRYLLWWACEGECKFVAKKNIDLWGLRLPPRHDGRDPRGDGQVEPEIVPFLFAGGSGNQIRPRIDYVDDTLSVAVYEDCPEVPALVPRDDTKFPNCGERSSLAFGRIEKDPGGQISVYTRLILGSNEPGETYHWPDIQGDIAVWDYKKSGSAADIWGCQFDTDYDECQAFQITSDPESQARPTIYDDLVGWGDQRRRPAWELCCGSHTNLWVGRLTRSPSGRIETVEGSRRALLAEARLTWHEPARQRAPRAAGQAMIWADTRFTGCAYSDKTPAGERSEYETYCSDAEACGHSGRRTCRSKPWLPPQFSSSLCCPTPLPASIEASNLYRGGPGWHCDDALGAQEIALVPLIENESCVASLSGDGRIRATLRNEFRLEVTGELVDAAICSYYDADDVLRACSSEPETQTVTIDDTLERQLSCNCPTTDPTRIVGRYQILSFTPTTRYCTANFPGNEAIAHYTTPSPLECEEALQGEIKGAIFP